MTRKIALDLESVLADPQSVAIEKSDILEPEHGEGWSFETDELFEEFMEQTQRAWEENNHEIEPTEYNIGTHVSEIREFGTVDLVTNRSGVDDHIADWLQMHNVTVNEINSNDHGTRKARLDYDVYIDDNPHMIGEPQFMYLYDQPWNQEDSEIADFSGISMYTVGDTFVRSSNIPTVARVHSLSDVVDDMRRRFAVFDDVE